VVKDAAAVALEMGNSPRKLFENYRELVTTSEGKRWFAVMPPKDGKIIDYPSVAAVA
jgi:hypothetical protein